MGILDSVKASRPPARASQRLDLHEKAVDLMRQVTALSQENYDLKNENLALKQQLDVRASLDYRFNAYWRTAPRPNGEPETWPYCTKCWDSQQKLIRYREVPGVLGGFIDLECPECKSRNPTAFQALTQVEGTGIKRMPRK